MKRGIISFLLWLFLCYSSVLAQVAGHFQFRFVCENDNEKCDKIFDSNAEEELLVEKRVILSDKDIEKVEVHFVKTPASFEDFQKMITNRDDPSIRYQNEGRLNLLLTQDGKDKFAVITSNNVQRRLSVSYDGRLLMAPEIAEPIKNGELEIVGPLGEKELQRIAEEFNKDRNE